MPNWKKVITSGSAASLYSLDVSNGITGSLLGTSSYALQALSSSFALTAGNGGVTKIIAINTGPSIPLYNTDILNKVDVIYLFGAKGCIPTGPSKTHKIKEVSKLNELEFLIEE